MASIEGAEKNTNKKIDKKVKKLFVQLMFVVYEGGHKDTKEDIVSLINNSEKETLEKSDLIKKIDSVKMRRFKD